MRSPPPQIFPGHLLYQSNRIHRYLGTTAAVARFEFPEQTKAWAMPAERGIGFQDQRRVFPVLHTAGKWDEPEAIRLCQARFIESTI